MTGVTIQKNGYNKKKVFQGMLSNIYISSEKGEPRQVDEA